MDEGLRGPIRVALKSQGPYCPQDRLDAAQADERETYIEYLRYVKMIQTAPVVRDEEG